MSNICYHPSRLCPHNWLQCIVAHNRSWRKASRSNKGVCTMLNYDRHSQCGHIHHISVASHWVIPGVFLLSRYPLVLQQRPSGMPKRRTESFKPTSLLWSEGQTVGGLWPWGILRFATRCCTFVRHYVFLKVCGGEVVGKLTQLVWNTVTPDTTDWNISTMPLV